MSQALIITGMHRSGTSFVAELFKSAGLHIGERLFPGDVGNPRGYFEDEDILTLQRTMLAKACPPGVTGWPDWGWTEAEDGGSGRPRVGHGAKFIPQWWEAGVSGVNQTGRRQVANVS